MLCSFSRGTNVRFHSRCCSTTPSYACSCEACILIRAWEAARRQALAELESSGKSPWIGAWNVRPDAYIGSLGPSNIQEFVPIEPPGSHPLRNGGGTPLSGTPRSRAVSRLQTAVSTNLLLVPVVRMQVPLMFVAIYAGSAGKPLSATPIVTPIVCCPSCCCRGRPQGLAQCCHAAMTPLQCFSPQL